MRGTQYIETRDLKALACDPHSAINSMELQSVTFRATKTLSRW
jgi:hypothetical protein